MFKILLAIDGSANSLRAAQYVASLRPHLPAVEIHLLNVQLPMSGDVKMFINSADIKGYHHDEAIKALHDARQILDSAGIPYEFHIGVGPIAETIAHCAKEEQIMQIVMGTRGQSAMSSLILGSVTQSVIQQTAAPVTLIK